MPSTLGAVASGYSGFSPLDLDASLWLDASDPLTVFSFGGRIYQWQDKSSNSRHVLQAVFDNRPTLLIAAQNGLNTISFNGLNFLSRPASGFPTTSNRTMFTVAKYTGSSTEPYQHIAIWGNVAGISGSSWGLTTYYGSGVYYGSVHIWAEPTNSPVTAQAINAGTWNQMTAIYNGSGTTIWGNGVQGETKARVLTTLTDGLFVVGSRTFAPAEYWTGEIAEIILYDYALTDSQRLDVETYLSTKWGTQ